MTDPIKPADPQYPNPPVKMWGGAFKTLTIWAGGALVVLVFMIIAARSLAHESREEVFRLRIERLESAIVKHADQLQGYENVRELVRARKENRPPKLSADDSDRAERAAKQVADSEKIDIDLRYQAN